MDVMAVMSRVADTFRMTDDAWKRHANPWSVWTRFAAIPLMILAIWSRVWLGWWCLVPIAVVMVWLWLKERDRVPRDHLRVLRLLVPVGAAGFVLLAYGLVRLEVWPTIFGASLIVLAQLWRIDRLVVFYESTQ